MNHMHTSPAVSATNETAAQHAHPDSMAMQGDHTALLDLMDARAMGMGEGVSGVATAVQSGVWSDPATWGGVENMPMEDASVVISDGLAVTLDADPGVKLMSVVVYGELDFATDTDIDFYVDEILTGANSKLTIGEPGDPVTADIDVIIRDDTPAVTDDGRVAIDPSQMGKGIVTHGEVQIEGLEKTSHLKVSEDPMAGDTGLTFEELPVGWAAGDKIVIAGTHISDDIPGRAALETPMKIGVLRAFDNNPDDNPKDSQYYNAQSQAKYNKFMEDFERDDPDFDRTQFRLDDPSTHPKGPGDWRFEVEEWHTQDEIRVVSDVSQNADGTWTVSFDEPLEFNHDAPKNVGAEAGREPVDFFTSVGNYSRNITISSEVSHSDHPTGADDIWVGDKDGMDPGEIHDRGHVMFMHNGDVEVRNVEFAGLGRTDKLQMLDDKNWEWGIDDANGNKDLKFAHWKMYPLDENGERVGARSDDFAKRDPFDIENHAGRYALHFHQTGVDVAEDPAIIEGNAVFGSPGWGIVHHDSHLDIIGNAVFGINGGGIVSETGNETGSWNNNLVIKTTGSSGNLFDSGGNEGREFVMNDGFHQGVAFGFESRFITSEGNIAASAQKFGYMFTSPINHDSPESSDNFLAEQGYDPFFGDQDIDMKRSPTRDFVDNEAFGSQTGFASTLNKAFPNTTIVSTVDGFDSWHNDKGVTLSYVRGYNFTDNIYVGDLEREFEGRNDGAKGWDPATDTDMNRLTNNHFENLHMATGHPEADIMVANTYTNVDKVWQYSGRAGEALEDAGGGFAHYIPNEFFEGTIIAETFEDLPRDVNHMELIIEESSDLSISNPGDGVWWHGHVEDAAVDASNLVGKGTTFFDFTLSVNQSMKIGTGLGLRHTTNWNDLIERDGFYSDDEGNNFLLTDLVYGSRVTASVAVKKVAIHLDEDYPLPPMAIYKGNLPHGMSMDDPYSDPVIVDLRLPGSSGNQLTEEEQQMAYEFLRPETQDGAGQFVWQLEESYHTLEHREVDFDRDRFDRDNSELKTLDTDAERSDIINIKKYDDTMIDEDRSIVDVFGPKFGSAASISDLLDIAGDGPLTEDFRVVDGAQEGDEHMTVVFRTGDDWDYLRVVGSDFDQALGLYYDGGGAPIELSGLPGPAAPMHDHEAHTGHDHGMAGDQDGMGGDSGVPRPHDHGGSPHDQSGGMADPDMPMNDPMDDPEASQMGGGGHSHGSQDGIADELQDNASDDQTTPEEEAEIENWFQSLFNGIVSLFRTLFGSEDTSSGVSNESVESALDEVETLLCDLIPQVELREDEASVEQWDEHDLSEANML